MLIVSSTGQSTVTATLVSKAQNRVNPYFTWTLFHKASSQSITFSCPDISTSPNYWNQFVLTVATASVGLTNGIIPLIPGEYIYNIYEMVNYGDLNISDAVGNVENGILVCGLSFSTTPAPMADNNIVQVPVYRPTN